MSIIVASGGIRVSKLIHSFRDGFELKTRNYRREILNTFLWAPCRRRRQYAPAMEAGQ
jgi:hypothetical protein